jgi:hypothetical protein
MPRAALLPCVCQAPMHVRASLAERSPRRTTESPLTCSGVCPSFQLNLGDTGAPPVSLAQNTGMSDSGCSTGTAEVATTSASRPSKAAAKEAPGLARSTCRIGVGARGRVEAKCGSGGARLVLETADRHHAASQHRRGWGSWRCWRGCTDLKDAGLWQAQRRKLGLGLRVAGERARGERQDWTADLGHAATWHVAGKRQIRYQPTIKLYGWVYAGTQQRQRGLQDVVSSAVALCTSCYAHRGTPHNGVCVHLPLYQLFDHQGASAPRGTRHNDLQDVAGKLRGLLQCMQPALWTVLAIWELCRSRPAVCVMWCMQTSGLAADLHRLRCCTDDHRPPVRRCADARALDHVPLCLHDGVCVWCRCGQDARLGVWAARVPGTLFGSSALRLQVRVDRLDRLATTNSLLPQTFIHCTALRLREPTTGQPLASCCSWAAGLGVLRLGARGWQPCGVWLNAERTEWALEKEQQ